MINHQTVVTLPSQPTADPDVLRQDYLNHLFETAGILQLSGVDPKTANESSSSLNLGAVYTALLTQAPEELDRENMGARGQRRLSALEQLNRQPRLVLLGDPGSGKSTFVNFVALCLAGEALGHTGANLKLLTAPLPKEPGQREEPEPQPWKHGALLPVRVVLRDFAARGLPPAGQKATARHLWEFIVAELAACNLGEYAPSLNKHLREQGGLLLVDGLDEVPEAEQRRAQIKQAVESFASSYPRVRILVTSRTYAYQKQDWQLNGFQTTLLAPFSRGQIEQFISRWYVHIAAVRHINETDAQGRAALLRQAVFGSNRLMGLAERPLLLTLMASLHAWRGGSLPEKREELYADAVDLLLDSWEGQRVVRGPKGELVLAQPSLLEWLKVDREKVRDLLNELAYAAHTAQPDLTGTADIPQADLFAGLMRLSINPDVKPARLVEFLRDRAGLLLPRGEGVFAFPHRTFQEYLAACYLTDHLEPDQIAALFCQDRDRWREVLLLAAAKATKGMALGFWALIEELCPADPRPGPCDEDALLWGAHLAGQALTESASLERVSSRNQARVARVRGWLVHILQQGELPARERALAGNTLARLGDPRLEVITVEQMQFCHVLGGPFRMGSDSDNDDEKPQHKVNLPYDFWIGTYPVTNAQFRQFVEADGYTREPYWAEAKAHQYWSPEGFKGSWDEMPLRQPRYFGDVFDLPNHPVVGVSWYEALAFCRWMGEQAGAAGLSGAARGEGEKALRDGLAARTLKITLPSEAEWEKAARGEPAARGTHGQIYPWDGPFDPNKANTSETGIGGTSAVGCFPGGASPYGLQDMSGNVWEWTRSQYRSYPYDPHDGREDLAVDDSRMVRGGSWDFNGRGARCAYRVGSDPDFFFINLGFRVVVVALPSSL